MWDVPVITDWTILANMPFPRKTKRSSLLKDISIPDDPSVLMKNHEKLNKHKDLETDVSRMWSTKTNIGDNLNNDLQMLPGTPFKY